ncbi:uncharacterized protein BDZ99DRAFT_464011 [Mytilinidion resinicola]|uniref:C2H2-type domain-containing protein n=1 Tax=Mytilinidion resinicola TaxID=574789 RepID=A0A6A6YL22_9PEZI|nr:uncharacterized protein BDZ99DRAFT_464011 [Mytilinidion resinicola]KAF2809228.1 hypothetical protein BDZ99DRAFT_464011 [Mytilinidion resinicola]
MASEVDPLDVVLGVFKSMKQSSLLTLLASVCREDERTLELIAKQLMATSNDVGEAASITIKSEPGESKKDVKLEPAESKVDDQDDAKGAGRRKRKRADYDILCYQTCGGCEKQFDVTKNNNTACTFHSGIVRPILTLAVKKTGENQDDFNTLIKKTRAFGTSGHNSLEANMLKRHKAEADLIKEHPEVARWDCCYRFPSSTGCKMQRHMVKEL